MNLEANKYRIIVIKAIKMGAFLFLMFLFGNIHTYRTGIEGAMPYGPYCTPLERSWAEIWLLRNVIFYKTVLGTSVLSIVTMFVIGIDIAKDV